MLNASKLQLANPKHDTYDWTNGAFYAGLFAAHKLTGSRQLLDEMKKRFDTINWRIGWRFDHADDIVISQVYFDIYRMTKDKRMIQPTIDAVNRIAVDESAEVRKHWIIWWWCDALFMAPPTLAKMSKTLNDKKYLEMNDRYFQETYDRRYNKDEKLFARDANFPIDASGNGRREANGKRIVWSRGNGWVMGGLVRYLEELPPIIRSVRFM